VSAAAEAPTWVACLTPPGAGAIATLAVRGPRAWPVVRELFHPFAASHGPLPDQPTPGQFWLGRLKGEAADEVVLAVKRVEPIPWLEIHCHGGIEVVRLICDTLTAHGLQTCTWPELEQHTADDQIQAEAAIELSQALTVRTAAILLDQQQGAFARACRQILQCLEDKNPTKAGALLGELLRWAPLGRHLTSPWKVAVLGAPNVGKSSLVNALAGFPRCIVAPTPGTTRDVVTTLIAVDGWPVELSDTAGLREATESLEAEGMQRARAAAAEADLCLWVLDASSPPTWPEPPSSPVLLVINKIDLPAAWDSSKEASDAVRVSALTGEGLAELCEAIARRLVPEAPPAGAAVPFTEPQCQALEAAWKACRDGACAEASRLIGKVVGRLS
jgi:tRNA modification GTPase